MAHVDQTINLVGANTKLPFAVDLPDPLPVDTLSIEFTAKISNPLNRSVTMTFRAVGKGVLAPEVEGPSITGMIRVGGVSAVLPPESVDQESTFRITLDSPIPAGASAGIQIIGEE